MELNAYKESADEIVKFEEYETLARASAIYDQRFSTIYPTLGLAGEAGEVADHIKKGIRDDGLITPERARAVKKELGDVLWYLTSVAADLGYSLEEVAQENIDKLRDRKERGVLQGSGDNR